jgi:hypothetical protein
MANVAVATSVLLTFISFWWAEVSPASGQAGRPRGSLSNPATIMYHPQSGWFDEGPQRGPIHQGDERALRPYNNS